MLTHFSVIFPLASARIGKQSAIALSALLLVGSLVSGCGGGSSSPDKAILSIATTSLPDGQAGTTYSAALVATGGTAPYAWTLKSGALPAGLTLNGSAGTITGTPTAAVSSTSLIFTVTDSSSPAQSQSVSLALTVAAAGSGNPVAITTDTLPSGQVGVAYSTTLAASGGTAPYSWSLTGGTMPAGLTLTPASGVIGGTPTAAVSATPLIFKVTDSSNLAQTASVTLSLTIAAAGTTPLSVTTSSLPAGQLGIAYSANLDATGGTPPYTWTLTSGSLPGGLNLDANAGTITGTPTASATSLPLTFTATDSSVPAQAASAPLLLTITSPTAPPPTLSISTATLPNGQAGTAYSATLTATGGTLPYNWTLTAGTLPSGLSLNAATGVISGTTVSTASATSLTFALTDAGVPPQNATVTLALTIAPPPALAISTASLPNGEDGNPYTAALVATGGIPPYSWTLTSGTLPAGLQLNDTTGAITGTPTTTATATPLTFVVSDSESPQQTKQVSVALTVYAANGITVSVSPQNAGITTAQTVSLTATTPDSAGIQWAASGTSCTGTACGTFSSTTSLSGVAVTYTPPATAGAYTLTASSVTNNSVSASTTVGVTNLAGVTTYHNDLARDGANTQEYALNKSNVTNATFGKLFSCTVDESVYAQPLWVPNLTIGGAKHNVVFVATMNDSVYAFDADTNTTPCTPLWHANLLDAAHGATTGETSVPSVGSGHLVGGGGGDIAPEVGLLGTPVIDLSTNTLYAVSKSAIASSLSFFQRLHALDLATGNEKFSGPVTIAATVSGNGDGGSTVTFSAQQENQRPGLALVNGIVYVAWASHEDQDPFYGWLAGYNAANLSQSYVFNVDPNTPSSPVLGNAAEGGIWMSGGAPAADSAGNLYLLTANGAFDPTTSDYGDSLLKLTANLTVNQYFTPSDQQNDYANDKDFGSGGAAVLVDLPANGINPTHLVVGGGKDGALYVINRDQMGGFGDTNAWQELTLGHGIFATGAFWNNTFYVAPLSSGVQAYTLNPSTAKLTLAPNASATSYGFPGATPSVTSMPDNSNGIVWALDQHLYCTSQSQGCGPAVLHAYDATNLATELWNSATSGVDNAGFAVKFTVPTVANGKVYVGTRGNNMGGADNSTTIPGELDVYGFTH